MTFLELRQAISDYMHDAAFTLGDPATTSGTQLISFITRTEQRIGRDLRIRENNVQDTVTPVSGVASLPTRYSSLRRISTGSGNTLRILQAITPDEADSFGLTGEACVYYISDAIYLFPPSDTDIDVDYYEFPEPLAGSADGATRPIMDRYESLYLNGALGEASLFLRDYDAAESFFDLFASELRQANKSASWADRPRPNTHYRLRGRLAGAT